MSSTLYRCLYLLFPKRCRLCGDVIALDEELCEACAAAPMITGRICSKCGMEEAHCTCQRDKFSPGYQSFCAPYVFDGSLRSAVYRLKEGHYTDAVPGMAEAIISAVNLRFPDVTFDAVTFVPMRKLRELRRGYNQSRLLAEAVAEKRGIPCEALLQKLKHTRAQHRSGAAQRKVNVYGAFALRENVDVRGKTILLVDDVKTTGYTLSECAVMLNAAGAKAVYAAAFTVADHQPSK